MEGCLSSRYAVNVHPCTRQLARPSVDARTLRQWLAQCFYYVHSLQSEKPHHLFYWRTEGEPVRRGVGEESYSAMNLEKCGEREVVGDDGELTLNWTHNKGTGHVERKSVHASMDGRVSWHAQGCALPALTTGGEIPNRPVPFIMQRSLTEAIRHFPQPHVHHIQAN